MNYFFSVQEQDDSHYNELWIVIVNDREYELNKKQAAILNEAISKGRGIVQFKEFIISIPYIKEFYLANRTLKPEYQIKPPETEEEKRYREYAEMTPEQKAEHDEKLRKSWEEAKKKADFLKAEIRNKSVIPTKKMTQKEFEIRRKVLLEQAKNL